MSSKILQGTFILAAGTMLSKIIGILYVAPFAHMVGEAGQALYLYSYTPYVIFISISTAGFPQAIAKLTAKYNTLGEYKLSRKMFHYGQALMLIMGFVSFLVLFLVAPLIAQLYKSNQFSVEDITFVIRVVSTALIIIPSLSFFRGYFQGHDQMLPTSVSQVVEQFVRVAFLLIGVYIVVVQLDKGIVMGIGMATAAAFVSALFGLLALYFFWYRQRHYFADLLEQDRGVLQVSMKEVFKEVMYSSLPFILVALGLPIFQLIDSFTFNKIMAIMGQAAGSDEIIGAINYQAQQLVMIPMTLATAMQISIVPAISATLTKKDYRLFKYQLNEIFMIMLLLLIPASIGLATLSEAFFTLFYAHNEIGIHALTIYAPVIVLFALFTVTAAILQGMNKQSFSIKSLLVGFLVKYIGNIILIRLIGPYGMIVASALGYGTIAGLNLMMIKRHSNFSFNKIIRRTLLIILITGVMVVTLLIVKFILSFWFVPDTNLRAAIIIAICVPIGAVVYLVLAYKTGLLRITFGPRLDNWMRKLRLNRLVKNRAE